MLTVQWSRYEDADIVLLPDARLAITVVFRPYPTALSNAVTVRLLCYGWVVRGLAVQSWLPHPYFKPFVTVTAHNPDLLVAVRSDYADLPMFAGL